jgi:hypothetical protein
MLVIADEHLGYTSIPSHPFPFFVKPVNVLQSRKPMALRAAIESTPPGIFAKRLRLQNGSVLEDIHFFASLTDVGNKMLYLFDPSVTSYERLLRIRNWLLPEIRLIPIPVRGNRVELYFIVQTLTNWLSQYGNEASYQQILAHVEQWRRMCTQWILSPKASLFVMGDKCNMVYKSNPYAAYKLIRIPPDGRPSLLKAGSLASLWDHVLTSKNANEQIWALQKGTNAELAGIDFLCKLDAQTLPVNIPFVHAIFSPGHLNLYS